MRKGILALLLCLSLSLSLSLLPGCTATLVDACGWGSSRGGNYPDF